MSELPDLVEIKDLVRLGAVVDGWLDETGEFRPGEAWEDCASRVEKAHPDLASWLRQADNRWTEIEGANEG